MPSPSSAQLSPSSLSEIWRKPAFLLISFSLALFLSILFTSIAQEAKQDFASQKAKAEKLQQQGNYAESLKIQQELLGKAGKGHEDKLGEVVKSAVKNIDRLGRDTEIDAFLESALATHPTSLELLTTTAEVYTSYQISHWGVIQDGEFQRGSYGSGRSVSSYERDRIRSLQLWEQALSVVEAEGFTNQKAQVKIWQGFANALNVQSQNNQSAWRLSRLTNTTELPDWDQPSSGGFGDGWPVEASGQAWFPALPNSYQAAKNDGERWRYLIERAAAVDDFAKVQLARTWQTWLSTNTLGQKNLTPFAWEAAQNQETRQAILTLHTLRDEESSFLTATGAQRMQLPKFAQFMQSLKQLAQDQTVTADLRNAALQSRLQELLNRRQFPQAAKELRQWITEVNKQKLLTQYQRNSLSQQLANITHPRGNIDMLPMQPVGKAVELSFIFRNADSVRFTAQRVHTPKLLNDIQAYLKAKPNKLDWERWQLRDLPAKLIKKEHAKYLGKIEQEWTTPLEAAPDHWDKTASSKSPLTEAGLWWIEAEFLAEKGAKEAKKAQGSKQYLLLEISPAIITQRNGDQGSQLFLADSRTGAPLAKQQLQLFGFNTIYNSKQKKLGWAVRDLEKQSNAQGLLSLSKQELRVGNNGMRWLVSIPADKDKAQQTQWLGWSNWYFQDLGKQEALRTENFFITTDRPVYRPSDSVNIAGWARKASYHPKADANPYAHKTAKLSIYDGRREKLVNKESIKLDAWGGFSYKLELEEKATLGSYQVYVSIPNKLSGNSAFQVEEYRKPEFTVTVQAPDKPVTLGDKFEATLKADYLFGAPVREGTVKYTVTRTEANTFWYPIYPYDWLFGRGYSWRINLPLWHPAATRCWVITPPALGNWSPWWRQTPPPEVIAQAEVKLGKEGTVTIPVDTSLAKALHGNRDHRYQITAEVMDASRRTVTGSNSVIAARESFAVSVWTSASFYRPARPIEVHIAARTPDGRPVPAQGTIQVLTQALSEEGKLVEEVAQEFPVQTDEQGNAKQTLSFPQSGQWRLEVKLTEKVTPEEQADGKEPKPSTQLGSTLVTVRGSEEQDIGIAYEELQLSTELPEYAPGQTARLLIASRFENATVLLWKRPQNGVYPTPEVIQLQGRTAEIDLKLTEADQPNFFVEAQLIQDAQVHRAVAQILVPPQEQVAQVSLTPNSSNYLPRENAQFTLQVTGPDGLPMPARVLITGYDKALEGIAGPLNSPDMREFFWGSKRSHYSNYQSNSQRRWWTQIPHEWQQFTYTQLGVLGYDMVLDEGVTFSGGAVRSRRKMEVASYAYHHDEIKLMEESNVYDPFTINASVSKTEAPNTQVAQADALFAQAPAAQAPAPALIQPTLRDNFADSLTWQAFLDTDAEGMATFSATMPDDLTTWQLHAWIIGPDTQVGQAKAEIITQKEVMVRLATPRFLIEKDEIVLTGNVNNQSDQAQTLQVSLELEGEGIRLIQGEAKTSIQVPAQGQETLEWRVKASATAAKSGEAIARLKALGTKDSDAIERRFPLFVHGIERVESWTVAMRPKTESQTLKFTLTDQLKEDSQHLQIRWSPTLAGSLTEALPFLAQYPHGCTEQTLNRFVPTVITHKLLGDMGLDLEAIAKARNTLNAGQLDDAGQRTDRVNKLRKKEMLKDWNPVFDAKEVKAMTEEGIAQLAAQQRSDGGWSWFSGSRSSSIHITAQVVQGLALAQDAGADVPEEVMRKGINYLRGKELREINRLSLPKKHKNYKHRATDTDALVHLALEHRRAGDKRMRSFLYRDRLKLAYLSQAHLGLVCHWRKDQEKRDMILRNLAQFLVQVEENQTAYLRLPQGSYWWRWWHDEIETQAAYLRLLAATDPKGELAARVAKYLVNNRASGSHWKSTRDTAAAVLALAEFAVASGESQPDLDYEIILNGKQLAKGKVSPENLFTQSLSLELNSKELPPGDYSLEFKRKGKSPLYASLWLEYFSLEDPIPAAGLEVKVARRYWKIVEEQVEVDVANAQAQATKQQSLQEKRLPLQQGEALQSGDIIEVELLIESLNDYEYLCFQDHKPAGFEPVELLSGWRWESLSYYQELRDKGAVIYIQDLPRGKHSLSYRLRAEAPGKFSALPTTAEAMYAPEIRANSKELKVEIAP